jgi:hypothetical protein
MAFGADLPTSSLPGLTRQSILRNGSLFLMDARVKPAHDESSGFWRWRKKGVAK